MLLFHPFHRAIQHIKKVFWLCTYLATSIDIEDNTESDNINDMKLLLALCSVMAGVHVEVGRCYLPWFADVETEAQG